MSENDPRYDDADDEYAPEPPKKRTRGKGRKQK